jgi:hypothetical protein
MRQEPNRFTRVNASGRRWLTARSPRAARFIPMQSRLQASLATAASLLITEVIGNSAEF